MGSLSPDPIKTQDVTFSLSYMLLLLCDSIIETQHCMTQTHQLLLDFSWSKMLLHNFYLALDWNSTSTRSSQICTGLFNIESNLRSCCLFINHFMGWCLHSRLTCFFHIYLHSHLGQLIITYFSSWMFVLNVVVTVHSWPAARHSWIRSLSWYDSLYPSMFLKG